MTPTEKAQEQAMLMTQHAQSVKQIALNHVTSLINSGKLQGVNSVEEVVKECIKLEKYLWSEVQQEVSKIIK